LGAAIASYMQYIQYKQQIQYIHFLYVLFMQCIYIRALAIATKLAGKNPVSIRGSKRIMNSHIRRDLERIMDLVRTRIYAHAHAYTNTPKHTHTYTHTHTRTHTYTHTHTHTHTYTHIHTHVHGQTRAHAHTHAQAYARTLSDVCPLLLLAAHSTAPARARIPPHITQENVEINASLDHMKRERAHL
jgi:hypothetical protein